MQTMKLLKFRNVLNKRFSSKSNVDVQLKGKNIVLVSVKTEFNTIELTDFQKTIKEASNEIVKAIKELANDFAFNFKKFWVVPQKNGLMIFALLHLTNTKNEETEILTMRRMKRKSNDLLIEENISKFLDNNPFLYFIIIWIWIIV